MAFVTANLALIQHVNGFNHYRYDTTDTHATVDTNGYFNNGDDDQNLNLGDIITVVVWGTAVRSGTVSTYGTHIVSGISSGVIDVTDVTVGLMTDTD